MISKQNLIKFSGFKVTKYSHNLKKLFQSTNCYEKQI